jgi:ParB-like chromosome segregation protein Spo0J
MIRLNLKNTQLRADGLRFSTEDGVLLAAASRLQLDPDQPRRFVDEKELKELRADIDAWRSDGHGLLGSGIMEPLKCRWEPGSVGADGSIKKNAKLLVWDGGRKWRVTHEDYDWLPIILDDLDSKKARSAALRTGIHNKAHTPIEQGHAFADEMQEDGLSYRAMAEKYSVHKSYIENRVNLLKCPPDVQKFATQHPALMSHALAMREVGDKSFRGELMELATHRASVREIEEAIEEKKAAQEKQRESQRPPDAQTAQRSAEYSRTGGGNMSRGKQVRGHSVQERREETENSLLRASKNLEFAQEWLSGLSEKDRLKYSARFGAVLKRKLFEMFPDLA